MAIAGEPAVVAARDVPRVALDPAVAEALRRELELLPTAASEDLDELLAGLIQATALLPREAVANLLRFRASPRSPSALLVSGLPVDRDLPPTPVGPVPASFAAGAVAARAMLLVAILLGEPLAYAAEKNGALVQHVYPTEAERSAPSNESSAIDLGFHTELTYSADAPEQCFDVAAPDFVLLLALRSPPERSAITSIVDARELCDALHPVHLAALRDARFELRAPHSFAGGGARPWSSPLPLVRGPADAPSVVFDIACGVRGVDEEAEAALDGLRRACVDPALRRSVELAPGELLAIENTRCAHARSAYDARFDGRDRWLLRTYVRRSLRGLRAVDASRFRVLA
jgi:L-asparagine oxygenase